MVKKWDGRERREAERRFGYGKHCDLHDIIQEQTKENKALVCSKIALVKSDLLNDIKEIKEEVTSIQKTIVGRWVFGLFVVIFSGVIGFTSISNSFILQKIVKDIDFMQDQVAVLTNIHKKNNGIKGETQ